MNKVLLFIAVMLALPVVGVLFTAYTMWVIKALLKLLFRDPPGA